MRQMRKYLSAILFAFALLLLLTPAALAKDISSGETLTEGVTYTFQVKADQEDLTQTFSFTCPWSGTYQFNLDDQSEEVRCYWSWELYQVTASGEKKVTREEFSPQVDLKKGVTYRLKATPVNGILDEEVSFYRCSMTIRHRMDMDIYAEHFQGPVAVGNPQKVTLNNSDAVKTIQWKSSDTKIATVDKNGKITGKKVGTVWISVSGTDIFGDDFESQISVEISNPKVPEKSVSMNIHGCTKDSSGYYRMYDPYSVTVHGIASNSEVSVKSSSKNLKLTKSEWGYEWGDAEFTISAKKAGTYTITIQVDGKKFTVPVYVRNAYFSRNSKTIADAKSSTWIEDTSLLSLYRGESTTLKVNGFPSGTKITYKSLNPSIATVNKNGKVTGKKPGYTEIQASAEGMNLVYRVGISEKTATLALRYANAHFGSVYSQAERMSKGKYDCSSFVWRSYRDAGMYLQTKSYAPTAADLGRWSVENGYAVYSGSVKVSDMLPGDLIFWCATKENGRNGGYLNGRFRNIYHVDLYQGNNRAITVRQQRFFWDDTITDVIIARPCGTKASGVRTAAAGYNRVKVSWSSNVGADGYQVYRSTSKNGKFTKVATVKNKTSYEDKVSYGKIYYYKVRPYWKNSLNSKKCYGRYSSVVKGSAKAVAPSVSATISQNSVRLSWNTVSGAEGYQVYQSTSKNGSYKKIATVKTGKSSYSYSKQKKGKTYYYKVRAYTTYKNKKVYSGYSNIVSAKVQ